MLYIDDINVVVIGPVVEAAGVIQCGVLEATVIVGGSCNRSYQLPFLGASSTSAGTSWDGEQVLSLVDGTVLLI